MNTQVASFREAIEKRIEAKRIEKELFDGMIEITNIRLEKFGSHIPLLEAALAKQGLKIETITFGKSGANCNVWEEKDELVVDMRLVPTDNSKFKFVPFHGYTSGGASKNADRRIAKALKLTKFVSDYILLSRVSVNEFSLDESRNSNPNRVMMGIRL